MDVTTDELGIDDALVIFCPACGQDTTFVVVDDGFGYEYGSQFGRHVAPSVVSRCCHTEMRYYDDVDDM